MAALEKVLETETVLAPRGSRGLLVVEGMVALLVGATWVTLVALLALAARIRLPEPQDHATVLLVVLAAGLPALLYGLFVEALFGRTLFRRWQGFEVGDLAGDPAPRARRLARWALKISLGGGCCIGFATLLIEVHSLSIPAVVASCILGALTIPALVYGPSFLIFRYRLFREERLTGDDAFQTFQLLPHDRLTGTRLVVRRRCYRAPRQCQVRPRRTPWVGRPPTELVRTTSGRS